MDFPALANSPGHRNEGNTLSTLRSNLGSERLHSFITTSLFPQASLDLQTAQEIQPSSITKPLSPPSGVSETIRVLTNQPGGLVHIIDDQAARKGKTERTMLDAMGKRWGKNRQFSWRKELDSGDSRAGTFTIEHWNDSELVTYSSESFLEQNLSFVPSDLVELLGGKAIPPMNLGVRGTGRPQKENGSDNNHSVIGGSADPFVRELFASEVSAAFASEKLALSSSTAIANKNEEVERTGGLAAKPSRKPSMRRKGSLRRPGTEGRPDLPGPVGTGLARGVTLGRKNTISARRAEILSQRCVLGTYNSSISDLFEALSASCRLFFLFSLSPQPTSSDRPGQISAAIGVDTRHLKSQIRALQLHRIRDRCASAPQWVVDMGFKEFWDRYTSLDAWQEDLVKRLAQLVWKDKMLAIKEEMDWNGSDFAIGKDKVVLREISKNVGMLMPLRTFRSS